MKLDELAIQFLPILFCELECRQRIVGGLEGAEDTLDAKWRMQNESCFQIMFQIESVISAPQGALKRNCNLFRWPNWARHNNFSSTNDVRLDYLIVWPMADGENIWNLCDINHYIWNSVWWC